MESYIDNFFAQEHALKKVVHTLPSSDSAKELFEKWLKSSCCEDWHLAWEYLRSLDLKDYLRMYAELPELLIKQSPGLNTPEYELFRGYSIKYKAVAIWLNQLASYDTKNNPKVYTSQELGLHRNQANIVLANLDLCRAIIRHPKSKTTPISCFFYTPTYLWFWSEVANCIKYFKNSGLLKPIEIKEIKTKHQDRKEWGQLLSFFKDEVNDVSTKTCDDWRDFLENIPVILLSISRSLLETQPDLMLENAIDGYIQAHHSLKYTVGNSEKYQAKTIYQDKKQQHKVFTSGAKQKRPKY